MIMVNSNMKVKGPGPAIKKQPPPAGELIGFHLCTLGCGCFFFKTSFSFSVDLVLLIFIEDLISAVFPHFVLNRFPDELHIKRRISFVF